MTFANNLDRGQAPHRSFCMEYLNSENTKILLILLYVQELLEGTVYHIDGVIHVTVGEPDNTSI